jgi:RNA polymerase sigma factor (sigma-70 family)
MPLVEPTRAYRFERLFRQHYPLVRAYALRRAAPDAAQDVVADTFVVAWRRLEDVPDDPLPWLYATARKVLANQRRSASRSAALHARLASAAGAVGGSLEAAGVSADAADRVADAEVMRLALARLSDRGREALMLVAWEGLSGARAARAAGCSKAAFAVRLHRARARLADELAALEGGARQATEPTVLEVM